MELKIVGSSGNFKVWKCNYIIIVNCATISVRSRLKRIKPAIHDQANLSVTPQQSTIPVVLKTPFTYHLIFPTSYVIPLEASRIQRISKSSKIKVAGQHIYYDIFHNTNSFLEENTLNFWNIHLYCIVFPFINRIFFFLRTHKKSNN